MELIGEHFKELKQRLKQRAQQNGKGNSPRSAVIHTFYERMWRNKKQWLESKGRKYDDARYKTELAVALAVYDIDDLRVLYHKCHQANNFGAMFHWYVFPKKEK